jgi:hypothetical protein
MLESLTFFLAILGYTGLTLTAVAIAWGRLPVWLWRGVAAIILVHVLLVWSVRYGWQFGEATRNGYVGFLLFHTALVAILASVLLRERVARWLIWGAFVIVSIGALGATFRYEVVALYRIPVMLAALVGTSGLIWAYSTRRRRTATQT